MELSLGIVAGLLVVAAIAGPVAASPHAVPQDAEEDSPSATLVDATIAAEVGEPRSVDARYRFLVDRTGTDGALSEIEGTVWRIPDRRVSGVSAAVDGRSVEPAVERSGGHLRVGVPLTDVADGDTVSVRLRYRVSGPERRVKAPLWVPEFRPEGTDRSVAVSVRLPPDAAVRSAVFPRFDSRDGRLLRYRGSHVPGVVHLRYGHQPRPLTLDRLVLIAGLLLVGGAFGGWLARVRRRRRG